MVAPSPSAVLSHLLYNDPSCPCLLLQRGEGRLAEQLYFRKFPAFRGYRPIRDASPKGETHPAALSLLRTDTVPEEGEDAAATLSATETLSEEEQEELRRELVKVEEEIQTLSQVLAAKEKHLTEIKRKLGINSLQELKQNIAKGWQDVTATTAYKKTSETLSQAGQKASAALSSVSSVITRKLEDVKNSPTFKSFEEKVENLKASREVNRVFVTYCMFLNCL
ncbi:Tumor protein D52 [Sciurus carolinensis]|uniref:Tumor protein D52 n=1 Tax=Sciurus carolinensis TaxID=30640 RepID=A0AA41N0Z7_SCICA|nr:Tumor protein D52 [Sciurus carolinensis]